MLRSSLKTSAVVVLLAGLLVGGMGCSFLTDDFDGVTVVNATSESFVFFGVDRELSHRMDPLPRIPLDAVAPDEGPFLLAPEESKVVRETDIDGGFGPDQTLRLFLYEVRGDTAYAAGLRDVPYDVLNQRNFRVEITAFRRAIASSRWKSHPVVGKGRSSKRPHSHAPSRPRVRGAIRGPEAEEPPISRTRIPTCNRPAAFRQH